jgi:hypothetical protein
VKKMISNLKYLIALVVLIPYSCFASEDLKTTVNKINQKYSSIQRCDIYKGYQDKKHYFECILEGANQGHSVAQWTLAGLYSFGVGVKQNDSEAVKWLLKAANHPASDLDYFPAAFEQLCQAYTEGKGTPSNVLEANKWCQKATAEKEFEKKVHECIQQSPKSWGKDCEELSSGQRHFF